MNLTDYTDEEIGRAVRSALLVLRRRSLIDSEGERDHGPNDPECMGCRRLSFYCTCDPPF